MATLRWSALAIALASVLWFLARDGGVAGQAAKSSGDPARAHDEEVEQLHAQVLKLQQRVAEQQGLLAAKPDPSDLKPAQVEEPEPRPLAGEEAIARLKTHFAETFANEQPDRQRGEELLKGTREIFEAERLPVDAIEEVDCRETMCRLSVRHSEGFDRDSVSRIFGRGVLSFGSFDFLQDGRTVAYVGAGVPLDTPPPSSLPPTAMTAAK